MTRERDARPGQFRVSHHYEVKCALCGAWVRPRDLADHVVTKHPQEELPL